MVRLGVDIGGTTIKAGVTRDGVILRRKSCATAPERGAAAVLRDIAALCAALLGEDICGSVGVGAPGVLSADSRTVLFANNLGWKNLPLCDELSALLKRPVVAENDASCALIAESRFGAAKGFENVLLLTLGTGLGGAILAGGELFHGSFCTAGEIGHTVIMMGGEPCSCGRRGCAEAYCAAPALLRGAAREMEGFKGSALWRCEELSCEAVFTAAAAGDSAAIAALDGYFEPLSEVIANLVNVIRPELVLLGGGVSQAGDALIAPVAARSASKIYAAENGVPVPRIMRAALGNDAGIIGAANAKRQ